MDGNPGNSTGFRGTGRQGAYKKEARWAAGQVIDFPWVCVGCGGRIRTYDLQVMSLFVSLELTGFEIRCNRFASWHSQVKACSSVEFLLS